MDKLTLLSLVVLAFVALSSAASDESATTPEASTTANSTKTEAPTTVTEAPTTVPPTTEATNTAAATLPTGSTISPIPLWYVEDPKTKDKCILAQFQLQFTVPYNQTWDNKTYMATASFVLPQNATVDKAGSSCSAGVTTQQQLLKLQFGSGTVLHNVTVRFSRANETANVVVDEIAFEYDLRDTTKFVNASKTDKPLQRAFSDKEYVSIPKDNYYSCDSAQPAALKNDELNLTVTASFSDVKAEAFRTSNTSNFDGPQFTCPFDPTTPMPVTTTTEASTTAAPTTMSPTTAAPTLPTRSTISPMSPWYVEDSKTKDKCILAQFQLQFIVPYNQTSGNGTHMATASFFLPQNATVDTAGSSCSAGTTTQQQLLKLQFGSGTVLHNVTVRFSRANETANVDVNEIAFEYDLRDSVNFINVSKTDKPLQRAFSDQKYVSIPKANYYSCDSAEPAALKNEELNLTVTASFSGVKAEAFRTSNTSSFDDTQFTCPFDHTTPMPVTTTPGPVTRATYNLTVANKTCLMAWFQMSLMLKYNTTDKKVAMHTFNSTDTIGTVNAKMSSCDNKTATLFVDGWIDDGWSFALDFAMADNKFSLSHVQVNFTLKDSKVFVNASDDGKTHVSETNLTKWSATVGHSYTCKDSDVWSLNVDEFKNFVPELSITLSNIQVQAFMSADAVKPEFGTAEDCSYTSDIVPIAVGCALALLVVIVLIAYVIGRRRNRARGYESM